MNLVLERYDEYISDEEKRCDATTMFFENKGRKEFTFTHNEVAALFYARHSKINQKDNAIYLEVLDLDTGEFLQLNARKDIHELMVKYMLYPSIILNVLRENTGKILND